MKLPKSKLKIAFCEHYAVLRNGSKAAIKAGYSEAASRQKAYELLQEPEVQEYIKQLEQERLAEAKIDAVAVLLELKKVAFSNIGDYVQFDDSGVTLKDSEELSNDQLAAIAEISSKAIFGGGVERKFRLHSKLDALSQIRAMQGLDEPKKSEKKLEVNIPNNVENKTFSLKTRSKKQDEGI